MLILSLLTEGDKYGYQMIEELSKKSNNTFQLKAGTIYPLLHTLEQQGFLAAYDGESEKNRPRRYYKITKKGRGHLKEKKKEWDIFASAIDSVMGGVTLVKQWQVESTFR